MQAKKVYGVTDIIKYFVLSLKDLIKIYKLNKKSDISNKIGVVLLKLNKKKFARQFFEISAKEDNNNFTKYLKTDTPQIFFLIKQYKNDYKKKNIIIEEKKVEMELLNNSFLQENIIINNSGIKCEKKKQGHETIPVKESV